MLDQDLKILKELTENYSFIDMLNGIAYVFKNRADDLSDLGSKYNAHSYAEAADLIVEVIDALEVVK